MGKAEVLVLLREGAFVSGEEISRKLGITRAAVWKAVKALETEGCLIESVRNRGYRLCCRGLTREMIAEQLDGCPWQVQLFDELDSTNNELKRQCNAPHGTVLVTARQTGGRGRLGRQFASPRGGVYLSVLLRPQVQEQALMALTPMTAVAVRRAIFDCCGVNVGIKWTNDLVFEGKKLCGILTELSTEANSGALQSAIVGIGINCNTTAEQFPQEVQKMAVSLRGITGEVTDPNRLAACVIRRMYELDQSLECERAAWMREYESACITIGQTVQVLRGGERRLGFAEGIDEFGGLHVRWEDGSRCVVSSGEVSVRGMYGYV